MEENYQKLITELKSVEGTEKLIEYLDTTDFKSAPASAKYHLCEKGGLVQHSLNVLRYARELNKSLNLNIVDSSLIKTALLHDVCKIGYYIEGEEWDKEHKDKTNQWRKKFIWKVEDQLPLGHGEKSLSIVNQYLTLTPEEMLAIRWHMGPWEMAVLFYPTTATYNTACDKSPLVKLISIADQVATLCEGIKVDEIVVNDLPF